MVPFHLLVQLRLMPISLEMAAQVLPWRTAVLLPQQMVLQLRFQLMSMRQVAAQVAQCLAAVIFRAGSGATITVATNTGGNLLPAVRYRANGTGLITFGNNNGTITFATPTASGSSIGANGTPVLINGNAIKTTTLNLTSGSGGAFVQSNTCQRQLFNAMLATNAPLTVLSAGN